MKLVYTRRFAYLIIRYNSTFDAEAIVVLCPRKESNTPVWFAYTDSLILEYVSHESWSLTSDWNNPNFVMILFCLGDKGCMFDFEIHFGVNCPPSRVVNMNTWERFKGQLAVWASWGRSALHILVSTPSSCTDFRHQNPKIWSETSELSLVKQSEINNRINRKH